MAHLLCEWEGRRLTGGQGLMRRRAGWLEAGWRQAGDWRTDRQSSQRCLSGGKQTDRLTEKQRDRQTDRETDRERDRQADR